MPINLFSLSNTLSEHANKDIEEMVFESLKQNKFDAIDAFNNPSQLKNIYPLYGSSMIDYISRNTSAILNKFRDMNFKNLDVEEIKKLIHKEILDIELLTHRRYINSEDKDIKENSYTQVKRIIEELTQLNDPRIEDIKKEYYEGRED